MKHEIDEYNRKVIFGLSTNIFTTRVRRTLRERKSIAPVLRDPERKSFRNSVQHDHRTLLSTTNNVRVGGFG